MQPFLLRSFAFAALSLSSVASAHDTVPRDWCVDPTRAPKIVATFELNGDQLQSLVDKCGIVDVVKPADAWTLASLAIAEYCRKLAISAEEPVPFISGPKPYLSSTHHADYRIKDGLAGVCAVCPTR